MITINNLTVTYDQSVVLDNLSLKMDSGKIHGLVGLNGSGKTTLIKTLYGLIKPLKGSILWHNEPLDIQKIAYLETQSFFYQYITAFEYLSLFKARNPSFDIEGWNSLFELPLNDLIESYSSGMKKKLALMAVLSLDKDFLILDEPNNNLDMETNTLLNSILLKLKAQKKTILITSHILETLLEVCDYIHFLNNKKIEKSYERNEFEGLRQELNQMNSLKNDAILSQLVRSED